MKLTEYLAAHNIKIRVFVSEWMEENPEVAKQAIEGVREGVSYAAVAKWLDDTYDYKVTSEALRRYIQAHM